MRKWIIRVALALVVLVLVVVLALGFSLDSVIKKGVETFGPKVAKVDVKLAVVDLSLLSGSGSIKGLLIGNPEGYQSPHAVSVGRSSVAIIPSSLWADKVVVRSIRIEAPEITLELGPGGSNLQRIQANLKLGAKSTSPSETPATGAKPSKKLQVHEVVVTGGKITLAAALLGGKLSEVPLPEVRLNNLGNGPEGITASDLGARILSAVLDGAIRVSGEALARAGKDTINSAASGVSNVLNKAASDAGAKATKGISELLNKQK